MKFNEIFLLFLILPLLFSCTENNKKLSPKAVKGVLNLSTWDFEKDGVVTLSGKWEFYWEQLLSPADFENQKLKTEYIYVPQGWSSAKANSKKYPQLGYATYRLKILLPKSKTQYRLLFGKTYSSAKVYVNENLMAQGGEVGTNEKTHRIGSMNFDDYFGKNSYPASDEMDLIIQVSNFDVDGAHAGLYTKIYFGTKEAIQTKDKWITIPALFAAGMLFMIGIYHIVLFFYRPNEYSTLVFAILSLGFVIRVAYEKGLIFRFLVEQTVFSLKIASYTIIDLYIFLMPAFFYLLFRKYFHKTVFYIFISIALINFTSLLFPLYKIMPFDIILFPFVVLNMLYLNAVAFRAMFNKEQGAIWAFAGIFVVLCANFYDILIALGVFNAIYISAYGFTIYVIFQAINIAERFSLSFKKNRNLNKKLDYQNKNLEKIVNLRTLKMQEQQEEILSQNQELRQKQENILSQNEELKQQQEEILAVNENIERQHRELQNKNTAITDSIRYARTIQKAILPTQNYRKELLPKSFVIYRPKDIVSGDFFWIKDYKDMQFIACVDCTGHGVPGAFMSMIGNNLLNEAIDHKHYSQPSQILNYLSNTIRTRLNQDETKNHDGMDISICRFEKLEDGKSKLLYAGAKSTIYLIQNNEMSILKGDRKSIGGMYLKEEFLFQDFEMELEEGDMIYMASDGYIDQSNEERKRFGSKRFKELIQTVSELSIEEQKSKFNQELDKHQGIEKQRDDITVIGIRI